MCKYILIYIYIYSIIKEIIIIIIIITIYIYIYICLYIYIYIRERQTQNIRSAAGKCSTFAREVGRGSLRKEIKQQYEIIYIYICIYIYIEREREKKNIKHNECGGDVVPFRMWGVYWAG